MPSIDLKSDDGLKAACAEVRSRIDPEQVREVAALIREVRDAPEDLRADLDFQSRIWHDLSLWRGGLMTRRKTNAGLEYRAETFLEHGDFLAWFASQTAQPLPEVSEQRVEKLTGLFHELLFDRIKPIIGWEPWVETLRTLACFFPEDFTALCNTGTLTGLVRAMGRKVSDDQPVRANRIILDRLDEVIGPPSDGLTGIADRMLLVRELGTSLNPNEESVGPPDDEDSLPRGHRYWDDKLPPIHELWETLVRSAETENLRFDRALVEALHLGLWADDQRHFGVLSGLSGTGKTQIALRYAMALTGAESDTGGPVEVISVHPGWHDPGPLLGYVNPLTGGYTRTEFLDFLLAATDDPDQPHVLILDEMNLSHPEQYFAPILSAMEIRDGEIPLHREDDEKLGVPRGVAYPANLVIIGTVNMDETTMGISDKVLDRAFTLEFWDIAPEEWPGWDGCGLGEAEKSKVRGILVELTEALSPARRHFGWRVIKEVVGFLKGRAQDSGIELPSEDALDQVIHAKVLPKLRGSDTGRFRNCLDATLGVLKKHGLARCAEKVEALKDDLEATGSCSFWR